MNKKRVAIIGATGFLGLYISETLSKSGFDVYGFIRSKNSDDYKIYKKLKLKTIIVGNLEEIKKIDIQKKTFDFVINLAARAHINQNVTENNQKFINKLSNIERNIVENFDNKKVKLIQISSAKVKLLRNHTSINKNELIYIKGKLQSEKIISKNFKRYIILRPPLVYGPHVKANFLTLMKAIDFGIPLPFANLKNARSYLYIGNLADLIIKIIKDNKFLNNKYYVCDGKPISTTELSETIAKHLSKKVKKIRVNINYLYFMAKIFKKKSLLDKVIGNFVVNNNVLKKDIDWKPKYNFTTGIKNTCFWYKTMFKMKE